ncbi:MAG TPA: XRE family transcriptional regulator [Desulfobulbus sp.]|nr:XRE family transcriptional regulator [Desulfobulbus sp.]
MKNAKHTVSEKFPERLRLARQQKGFTQGQLAQRVGSDSQRISKYERGGDGSDNTHPCETR